MINENTQVYYTGSDRDVASYFWRICMDFFYNLFKKYIVKHMQDHLIFFTIRLKNIYWNTCKIIWFFLQFVSKIYIETHARSFQLDLISSGLIFQTPLLMYFLATLVTLHFTPVSEWVSEWVSHSFGWRPSSVAWSLRACCYLMVFGC